MKSIGKVIDSHSVKYEHFILISDFKATERDNPVENFYDIYSFKKLIKEPTCFKYPYNPKRNDSSVRYGGY